MRMILHRASTSLILILFLGVTTAAQAKDRPADLDVEAGAGFLFGPGIDLNGGPAAFKLSFRGWVNALRRDRLDLGLVLPVTLGFSGRSSGNVDTSTTLLELAPSVRGRLTVNDLIRPYVDFGPGFVHASTTTTVRIFNFQNTSTANTDAFLLRIAAGLEITPFRDSGLVLLFEPMAIHLRFFRNATQTEYGLLFGAGYRF